MNKLKLNNQSILKLNNNIYIPFLINNLPNYYNKININSIKNYKNIINLLNSSKLNKYSLK